MINCGRCFSAEASRCILTEQRATQGAGEASDCLGFVKRNVRISAVSTDQWCEAKLRCGKQLHLWAEDGNCTMVGN